MSNSIQRGMQKPISAQATIERFCAAFAKLGGNTRQACCAVVPTVDGPLFSLRGRDPVGGMWRMLCRATQAKGRGKRG